MVKRKAASATSASATAAAAKVGTKDPVRATLHKEIQYEPLTLQDIHDRIVDLSRKVPFVPSNGFARDMVVEEDGGEKKQQSSVVAPDGSTASSTNTTSGSSQPVLPVPSTPCRYDKTALREWATSLQSVLEEFQLLIAVVSAATYRWGTDRSGAADQNLSVLSNELVRSQEQILGRVSPRLNDVLAPVVSVFVDKTVTVKDESDHTETKQNYYIASHEDPDYVDLSYTILARNAAGMRQVVLANFDKLLQAVSDYLEAQHKDSQHDSRGFLY